VRSLGVAATRPCLSQLFAARRENLHHTLPCTAVVISAGCLPIVLSPPLPLVENPVLGYSEKSQLFISIALGYFVWDVVVSVRQGWGLGYIAHGPSCCNALAVLLLLLLLLMLSAFLSAAAAAAAAAAALMHGPLYLRLSVRLCIHYLLLARPFQPLCWYAVWQEGSPMFASVAPLQLPDPDHAADVPC
jgi:hypothetical protein